MKFRMDELLTVTFTLFAVIDIVGSVPLLLSIKNKSGIHIPSLKATLISGGLMILFLFAGEPFLHCVHTRGLMRVYRPSEAASARGGRPVWMLR